MYIRYHSTSSAWVISDEFSCNFTSGKCTWVDSGDEHYDWARGRGKIANQGDFSPPGDITTGSSKLNSIDPEHKRICLGRNKLILCLASHGENVNAACGKIIYYLFLDKINRKCTK